MLEINTIKDNLPEYETLIDKLAAKLYSTTLQFCIENLKGEQEINLIISLTTSSFFTSLLLFIKEIAKNDDKANEIIKIFEKTLISSLSHLDFVKEAK